MEIDCGYFKLRPLQIGDKDSLATYANNIEVSKNLRDYFPHPYGITDAEVFINSCKDVTPPANLCIDFHNECVGVIGFIPQTDVYRKTAEIGYWLGEPFWGRGIMTIATIKMTEYIFEHFDIVRIQAGVFEGNTGSMKVLEKAGFRNECVFEKNVFKAGRLINEHRYSLIKS